MNSSRISIIVPIYNIASYLRQCIESILRQTYTDLEIILVDDGSTDGCYEICEEYRQKDSRVTVIHKENGGLVSACKAGIRAAAGDLNACVDGDDWIEPDMYERMYRKMTGQDVDVVMCGLCLSGPAPCGQYLYHAGMPVSLPPNRLIHGQDGAGLWEREGAVWYPL